MYLMEETQFCDEALFFLPPPCSLFSYIRIPVSLLLCYADMYRRDQTKNFTRLKSLSAVHIFVFMLYNDDHIQSASLVPHKVSKGQHCTFVCHCF